MSLSQGEKQKINIIRALNSDKEILLIDEASNYLDKKTVKIFHSLLEKEYLNKQRKIIVYVSHHSASFQKENCNYIDSNSFSEVNY